MFKLKGMNVVTNLAVDDSLSEFFFFSLSASAKYNVFDLQFWHQCFLLWYELNLVKEHGMIAEKNYKCQTKFPLCCEKNS